MFSVRQKVLFKHCDPAGIVFYPRYFEMMNDLVEHWFDTALHLPFERLHHGGAAVPTVAIATTFHAPSRHGDWLDLTLAPVRIGGASLALHLAAACDGAARFSTDQTIVNVGPSGRPARWDDDLRATIEALITPSQATPEGAAP